jgi:acetylornithine deacetylase
LILNSHIDTVEWQHSLDHWAQHPLSGQVAAGKLYGRGAMDAKGQLMAAFVAILALKDLGYVPGGRVMVQSVVSEEPDGNGTLALCAQGYTADAAINLEATGNRIATGHRGIIGLRYSLAGEVRHASLRDGRQNVIVEAGKLAAALDHSLEGWSHPSDAVYGPPTVNIGHIRGGDDIYTTPFGCTLDCGIRYAPGTYDSILAHVDTQLRERYANPLPAIAEAEFLHVDAADISRQDPFVAAFQSAVAMIEADAVPTVFPGGCDVRHFINRRQMPAVIFGPGDLALAHGDNEYLDLAQWERASQILALFITQWCGWQ